MTEAKQMIRHCLWKIPALAVFADTGGTVSFGQWRTIASNNQRHVSVTGRMQSERFQNHQLTRCVRQMILTSKHVRDTHIGVIHRIAKEKRGGSVSAPDHEITDVIRQKALRPVDKIHELDPSSLWHFKPHRCDETRGRSLLALFGR